MWGVLKARGKWLNELRAGQLAAYDVMVRQQAAMREVAGWEWELEDAIRELMRWLWEEYD